VVGKVAGWVRLPYKMAEYGADNGPFVDCQNGCPYPHTWQLLRDAAPMITSQVNIADYQQIVVLHAGYGEESSSVAKDIWSVTFLGQPVMTSQGTFDRFSVVPEFEARGFDTLGVYAHEFGHLLGLPDLYSRTLEEVGPWDLMARGAWNGKPPGSSPAELLAWDRIFLSWITPQHIVNVEKQSRMNVTIEPIESPSSGVQAVTVQASPQDSKHYYLVEVRQQVGFDAALPSSGVLITYIDETKSSPVKVIDGVQTTSTLNDAPFQVGQKYSDSRNNLVIYIAATNGSSFSVVVDTMSPSPDVAVESLTLDPPTVHPNNTASLTVRIANEGNLKAKPFLASVYLNETLFASRQISLNVGEEQEIRLSWTPTAGGTSVFKVVLDAENVLSESNKENNMRTLRAVVGYALTLQLRPPGAGADLQ
ncbi:M6 family metalloprotease domain-containing protein, partial [bacterium]